MHLKRKLTVMKPTTYLQIPTPCHEDWNKMTANEQGRYCDSCCKTVVDFQVMTDQQILNYFNTVQGKTCGRFSTDQLNRSLEETKIEKKKGWQWLVASITSFFFFMSRSNAQALQGKVAYKPAESQIKKPSVKGEPKIKSKPKVIKKQQCITQLQGDVSIAVVQNEILKGDTVAYEKKASQLIGSVTDEKGNAIAYVVVATKFAGMNTMTTTNAKGEFEFNNPMLKHGDSVVMKFSYLGYEEKTVAVTFDESQLEMHIQLKENAVQLKEVVVVSSGSRQSFATMAGGISYLTCKKVKRVDTISTMVRKVFKAEGFTIFPNPASKGKAINLTIKETGNYTVQLLNNESKLLYVENVIVYGKQEVKLFNIPSTVTSGNYYIRLINEKTKKQYIDKLIVQ